MPSAEGPSGRDAVQRAPDDHLPRRSACDRCRAHKLRCLRDDTTSNVLTPCRRCSKAGVTCSTGLSGRSGRPSKSTREKQPETANGDVPRSLGQSPSWLLDWGNDLQPSSNGPPLNQTENFVPEEHNFIDPCDTGISIRDSSHLDAGSFEFESLLQMTHMNPLDNTQDDAMNLEAFEYQANQQSTSARDQLSHDTETVVGMPEIHLEKTDLKEEVLRRLADLHSGLLTDLNIMRDVGKCPCQSASRVSLASSQRNADGKTEEYNFLIGRMLNKAETFVSILQHFSPPVPSKSSSGMGIVRSDSDRSDEDQDIMNAFTSWHNEAAPHESGSTTFNSNSSMETTLRCDVPMTLSILTCYVCLIRIYRTLFSSIHTALVISKERNMELPPLFPGLKLGGFAPHMNFQVQILVQLSANLLNKIDEALGLPGEQGQKKEGGGILDQTRSNALLQTMMKEEALEGLENGDPSKESPREIFRKLSLLC
ncbi:hypothetical protein L207DRAFT_593816 [Hyaloscypha variabilis F]|uniref:Zn(2)-C6 fungal-type domain-containing protein n=1 Tax=Hyaloscypha variabilis (strain UAMH 11265 / GT02V1 / F) TaxID=1149755 RepID=A0A2J6QS49_HYAVF|nr:hypothetical protein L207DRAFT_593816 [Hyaloscypha variabilis F]